MKLERLERDEVIKRIIDLEWDMFTNASNAGGRASCQDDMPTFIIMRKAQNNIWNTDTLSSYLNDLEDAERKRINLMAIKYARMMEITFPEEYEAIKKDLPSVSSDVIKLADEIIEYHIKWSIEASDKYPKLFSLGRPVTSKEKHYASIENYLRSELLTYSKSTLKLCLRDTLKAAAEDKNLTIEIQKYMAESYGYKSLDALEEALSRRS